ncbi:MAG: MFS transporter [Gaiellales bacterium]
MSSVALAGARTFRSLRRHRNYRLYFAGQVVSLAGTWMQNVALAWLVIDLSREPFAVGALAFCRFVPFTVFGLVAGVLADRVDTRRLVIGTQVAAMLVSVALAVVTLAGLATLPVVYVLATLGGVALVFDAAGRHTLTFQLVGERELPNAVALNASLFNASRVVGPAIAGVVIAAVGTGVCFAINAASFLAVIVALAAMRADELVAVERRPATPILQSAREGLVWATRDPLARATLVVVAVTSLLGFNFHVLVPLLAADTLHAGPQGLGLLSATFGVGALIGALITASRPRARSETFLLGSGAFSAIMLALAPVTQIELALPLLVALGVAFTLFVTTANSLVQLAAPDHLRGRAVSIYLLAFVGLAPVGGLLAGGLTQLGGTRLAFAIGGLVGLAATAWAARAAASEREPVTA